MLQLILYGYIIIAYNLYSLETQQVEIGFVPYLALPLQTGLFERQTTENTEARVFYKVKLTKERLKNEDEVHEYLIRQNIKIPISCFNFDPNIRVWNEYKKDYWKKMIQMDDLSEGKERIPIQVINAKSNNADFGGKKYVKDNFLDDELKEIRKCNLTRSDDFFECCQCENDCADKMKCSCYLKTLDNCSKKRRKQLGVENVGYKYQRLDEPILSGIFECNKMCSCNKNTCYNRVVQNGIKFKLQLFMSNLKGWAVRTLWDIPKGSFVCTYAGKVVSAYYASKVAKNLSDGKWKYLTELKIGEHKPGYEAEVVEPNPIGSSKRQPKRKFAKAGRKASRSGSNGLKVNSSTIRRHSSGLNYTEDSESSSISTSCLESKVPAPPTQEQGNPITPSVVSHKPAPLIKASGNPNEVVISSGDGVSLATINIHPSVKIKKLESTSEEYLRYVLPKAKNPKPVTVSQIPSTNRENSLYPAPLQPKPHTLLDLSFSVDGFNSTNIGGYINHSCDCNLFPQYVFYDTHDLRFPVIALFATRNIKSGEELTWNYKYESSQFEVAGKEEQALIQPKKRRQNNLLYHGPAKRAKGNSQKLENIISCNKSDLVCHCDSDNCSKTMLSTYY